jgi:hypothetical protein
MSPSSARVAERIAYSAFGEAAAMDVLCTDKTGTITIEACLRSMQGKLYHLGFRGKVARSTLADANESHDWRIFTDFAQILIAIARPLYGRDPHPERLHGV